MQTHTLHETYTHKSYTEQKNTNKQMTLYTKLEHLMVEKKWMKGHSHVAMCVCVCIECALRIVRSLDLIAVDACVYDDNWISELMRKITLSSVTVCHPPDAKIHTVSHRVNELFLTIVYFVVFVCLSISLFRSIFLSRITSLVWH